MQVKAYRTEKTNTIIFDFREVAALIQDLEIDMSRNTIFGVEPFKAQGNQRFLFYSKIELNRGIAFFGGRSVSEPPYETYYKVTLVELLTHPSGLVRMAAKHCLARKQVEVLRTLSRW